MCGIAGAVDFRLAQNDLTALITAMNDAHRRRGPDDSAVWVDGPAALGVRRLSVIDLTGGKQPMVHQVPGEAPVALAYSGEIFNFKELRADLTARGHRFTTSSDTEVVLRAYLEWGAACAERLLGMFAFAVWDGRTETLTLIRDRFGIYPLYWAPTTDGIVLGSEIKALLEHPEVPAEVDLTGLRAIATMSKAPDHGIFRTVREVEPGTVLTFTRAGVSIHRYWCYPARPHTDDLDTTVATIRELLEDSVRRQIVSDVPFGMFLSGGLDSSALAALASRALGDSGDKLRTFSVDYKGHADAFDADEVRSTPDFPFVEIMARHLGTQHTRVELSVEELMDPQVREEVLRARDIPTLMGDLDTSLYLLSKAARRDATVSLMGDAADELFGGYPWYHEPAFRQPGTLPWIQFAKLISLKLQIRSTSLLAPDLAKSLEAPEYERSLYDEAVALLPRLEGESDVDAQMREMTYLNMTGYLRTVVLDRKDRIGMAVALEGRVPFLDHRLVEYVHNIPWALKSFDGREKSLLRAAVRDLLPPSVLYRKKAGYPPTDDRRYDQLLNVRLAELIADETAPARDFMDLATAKSYLDDQAGPMGGIVNRNAKEMVLGLNDWLRLYKVRVLL